MEQQLKRIQDKLQLLVKEYQLLQKENTQLRQDLYQCREESSNHQKNIDGWKFDSPYTGLIDRDHLQHGCTKIFNLAFLRIQKISTGKLTQIWRPNNKKT